MTVEIDRTLGRIIKAGEQLDERCLTRTVQTDEYASITRFKGQIDVVQDIAVHAGITETDVVENDGMTGMPCDIKRFCLILGCLVGQPGNDRALFVHEHDQVINEQRTLIDRCGGCDQRGDTAGN